MRLPIVAFSTIVVAALAGCGSDDPAAPDAGAARKTWYQDVGPMLAEHCMGCHHDGGIAPFSLTDYEDGVEYASIALFAVEHGIMPPWDAVDAEDCTPRFDWRKDPRLSDEQIETLRIWIEDGMAAGEVAELPDPPDPGLAGVTHTVTPTTGHVTAGTADEFICYLLDPGLTAARYLNGVQVRPGNPKVVHHTVTWAVPPGAAQTAIRDASGVGVPFRCDGGASAVDGAYLIHVWTPGNEAMETPDELGIPLAAGTALLTQFHYHPGGISNDADVSSIDLRLTANRPDKLYTIGAWGNAFAAPELLPGPGDAAGTPRFFIPADEPAHAESMRFEVVADTTARFPLLGAYPHMHYIGVGLQVKITRANPLPGEPTEECLVNVDRWDFDWQRTYQYDAPIDELPTVGNGDVVEINCTYDNTMDNPFVERALLEAGLTAPIDVALGEESLDEMCLAIFPIIFDAPAGAGAAVVPALPFTMRRRQER